MNIVKKGSDLLVLPKVWMKKGADLLAQPAMLLGLALFAPLAQASDCARNLLEAQRDQNWVYQVAYQGMGTEATRRLESAGTDSWVLSQSMSLLIVSLNEKSSMQLIDGQLATSEYLKEQKGLGARTTQISVDSATGTVNSNYKGKAQSYQVDGVVLDPLSHSLQIQIDRHCGAASNSLEYRLVARSDTRNYQYQLLGEEAVGTPWGEMLAERWQRQAGDVRDTLWLVPDKSFALVRVEHEEKGELSSLELKALN